MAAFRYRARSLSGESQTGLLEAPNLDQAVERIHSMGLVPVRLEAYGAPQTRVRSIPFLDRKVSPRDLILFTRQLETMLDSGLPILSSLESLHTQTTHPRLKQAIDRVRSDVEQGSTLTEALRRQPDCFPRIYVNLVFAGEEGGLLAQMLDRVASLLEYEAETDQRVRSATFYPTLIVSELVLAFLVLIKFVLPRFASLFRKFDSQLPLPTRVLIGISDFFEHYWFGFLFVVVGAIAGATVWSRTERGRVTIDRFVITVPIFGPIFLMTIMSRFARVLSALLASGIPIVQALDIVRGVVGNKVIEAEIDKMRDGVVAGMGLAEPLRGSAYFPALVTKMLAVGEETGAIDKILLRVSRYYDQDVDYAVKNLSTAIEPVLLIILGAAVLFTALAVFLPLWNLMNVFRH
jgi:type II secretory pathway component PulF